MNELFFSLIESMKEEAACYRRLALLARDQKELLIAGNLKVMPAHTRLQEKQLFALPPIVGRREEILAKLAKLFRVKKIDLKGAVKNAPAEVAEDLKKTLVDLTRAAKELSVVHDLSKKLLNNAVKFTKYTLKVVREGGKKKSFSVVAGMVEKRSSGFNYVV